MSDWFRSYGFAEVYRDLIVGAYPLDEADVSMLARMRVTRVLNLVEDSEYLGGPPTREAVEQALRSRAIAETRLRLTDFGHLPAEQLEQAVTTIVAWMRADADAGAGPGQRIYVHCRAGWQRSAAVAAGAIAVFEGIPIAEALRDVQARKPTADPLPHQRRDLADWFERRGED